MGQMTLTEQQEYAGLREELKQKLNEASENFIIIGYLLKQVRDRQLYRNEAYGDIYEFGSAAFGLSKSTVSRFMGINTKFSVGGNSRELKPEYKGYGSSRLQEMLNMDEGDMELIRADTPVAQVKELKKAQEAQRKLEKQEQEKSLPLVLMAAGDVDSGAAAQEPGPADPFDMLMTAFWQENMDLYRSVAAGFLTPENAAEEICPSGSRTYRLGANMMFFYNYDCGAKLRSYAEGKAAITSYTYHEIIEKTRSLIIPGGQAPETAKNSGRDAEISRPETKTAEKPVATSQHGPEQEQVPYIPVSGQTTLAAAYDMPDAVPENPAAAGEPDSASGPVKNACAQDAANQGSVIEGEYRELDVKAPPQADSETPATENKCPYSKVDIKNAISYFDLEYSRMTGLQQNTAKRRNYRMALECIRKCYKTAAADWDREVYRTGV